MSDIKDLNDIKEIFETPDNVAGYRTAYKKLWWLAQVLGVVILALTGVVYYYVSNVRPQPAYYAQTPQGQKMRMVGLPQPNMTREAVQSWVAQAVGDVMSFGFHDVGTRFGQVRHYFTDVGWDSFVIGVIDSQLVATAVREQQVINTIPSELPTILREGVFGGKYGWTVQVPVLMQITAGGVDARTRATVMLTVVKMPTENNPMGIGIERWMMR